MTSWLRPAQDLELARDTVHVWRTVTGVSPARLDSFRDVLAPDERARAARFLYEDDRRRYTVARGVLRTLLGRDLRFNLSHSGGLALHAFAAGREVGVDVERIRPETDVTGVAGHSFSPAEVDALASVPAGRRREAFFNGWTRKEAFIKAHGEGIALGLSRFDVTLRPGEPARLLRFDDDPAEAARWTLCALEAGDGYKAALAVEGGGWRLECWEYPDDGIM